MQSPPDRQSCLSYIEGISLERAGPLEVYPMLGQNRGGCLDLSDDTIRSSLDIWDWTCGIIQQRLGEPRRLVCFNSFPKKLKMSFAAL